MFKKSYSKSDINENKGGGGKGLQNVMHDFEKITT